MRKRHLLFALLIARAVGAQPSDTSHVTSAPLFTARDAWIGAGLVLGTVAMTQLDRPIARTLQDPSVQGRSFLRSGADGVKLVNERSLFVLSAAGYVLGKLTGNRSTADLGWHAAESIVVTSLAATVLKSGLGRSRPFMTDGEKPFDFHPGKGFNHPQYRSFPSLHEGGSFAAAAALSTELHLRHSRHAAWATPVAYGLALLPGLGRMYSNKHWASDVVMGAAIGTFAGIKTVRYHHSHPRNRLDRWLLGASLHASSDGAALSVSLTP